MMKKLSKKVLIGLLKENYFMGAFDNVQIKEKIIVITYFDVMVRLWWSSRCQWNFRAFGEMNYTLCKHYVKLCDKLEELSFYYGDVDND